MLNIVLKNHNPNQTQIMEQVSVRSIKKRRKRGSAANYNEINCPRHKGVVVPRAKDKNGNMLASCQECLDKDILRQQGKQKATGSRQVKKESVVVISSTTKRTFEDGTESEVKTYHTHQMSEEDKVIFEEDERVKVEKQKFIDKLKSGQEFLISSGVSSVMVHKRLDFIRSWLNNEFGNYRQRQFEQFLNVNKVDKSIIENDGRWTYTNLPISIHFADQEIMNRVLLHLAYEQDLSKLTVVDIKTESVTCELVRGENTFDIPIELIYYSVFLSTAFKALLNTVIRPDKALIHHKLLNIAKEKEELEKNALSDNEYFAQMTEFWKRVEEPYVSKRKREKSESDSSDDEFSS